LNAIEDTLLKDMATHQGGAAMSLGKPQYVSDQVVYLPHELGVEYAMLNPGATTRGLHESLVTFRGNQAPEVITCCQEEIAVAMAEGYYLATGKPQVTLVHNVVGLQHASKVIYEAWLNNTPMIILGIPVRWTPATAASGSIGSTRPRCKGNWSEVTSSEMTSLRVCQ
jgi:hypothetical protein